MRKLLAIGATILLASVALASPAWAQVAAGRAVTVFPDRDIVGATGYQVGQDMTIQVFRNGVKIGERIATAQDLGAEGVGFEVNHLGFADGDCWTGVTPDIIAGDQVVVIVDGVETTNVTVPTIGYDPGFPVEVAAGNIGQFPGAQVGDVVLEGTGLNVDGTPIDVAALASLARIQPNPRYRAEPNSIEALGNGAWRATFRVPYQDVDNRDGLNDAQKKQAILDAAHEMAFTPNLQETYIAENGEPGGPALGCEAVAPRSANAVTAFDDEFVNIGSGSLVVSGTAIAETQSVSVSISDEAGNTITRNVAGGNLSAAGPGGKTWTVTVPRNAPNSSNDLAALSDGKLTVAGTYTGGGINGATKSIIKDTVAPAKPTATPGAGRYERVQRVTLSAENGTNIHYTVDGSRPTAGSRTFRAPIPVTATQTIKSIAVDGAGNRSQVAGFRYTILKRSFVSLNLRSANLKLGQEQLISGRVFPAHPGKAVRVVINRPGPDLVRNVRIRGNSTYVFRYKPNRPGRHFVRVSFRGDADHAASTTVRKTFRVRR